MHAIAAVAFVALCLHVTPAMGQDALKVTTRITRTALEQSDSERPDGRRLRDLLLGGLQDSTIITTTIGVSAIRVDYGAGRARLIRPGAERLLLNAEAASYWNDPGPTAADALPGFESRFTHRRTGIVDAIAGVNAERIDVQLMLRGSDAASVALHSIDGEVWVAPSLREYADRVRALAPDLWILPALAILSDNGLILRSRLSSTLLGLDIETETVAIEKVSGDFRVPSQYRRVTLPGSRPARLITQVPANYPADAARAKIDGTVVLDATVAVDGSVRNVRVIRSMGYGLDDAAVDAVRQWRYQPAYQDGVPIETRIEIAIRFTYRERPTIPR